MKREARILFIFTILVFLGIGQSIAQPPKISYQSPQTYNLNNPIVPLAPVNTGGAVPANTYGMVMTVAGGSAAGKVNAVGLAATFSTPVGLVCDPLGNVYISEYGNNDIRKMDVTGAVSTYAGNGRAAFADGPAAQASFDSPFQMAIDGAGNLYVADLVNNMIRKISKAGVVSVFAGSGSAGRVNGPAATAQFNSPIGVALDALGNMYIADRGNSTIRKLDVNGQVTTFLLVDNGQPPQSDGAGLDFLSADASGLVFFTNTDQVESATPATFVSVLAGNGTAGYVNGTGASSRFTNLVGIALDKGDDAYVADDADNAIRRVGNDGVVSTVAGETIPGFSDGVGSQARFIAPNGVAIDPTGNYLYVADAGNNAIRKVTITGYSINTTLPTGLVFNPQTGVISGTPVVATPPEVYTITAYNNYGSSSVQVVIQIINDQTVTFPAILTKTVCDADFNPEATGIATITYTSSNTVVATIVSGKIHITGAGTSLITASDGMSTATQTLTVTAAVTPTITITPASPDTCQNDPFTFTAQITGGGTQPTLQWKVNGRNAGTNSSTFVAEDLSSGDEITCMLTSNATCTTSAMATSNTAVFTLDPFVSTSASISSSETGMVCAGTPITFTAIAYSPNVHPGYQWQVNGKNAGGGQSTFTTGALSNGDTVTCVVTSTGKCIVDPQTTSNAIVVTFNPVSQCVVSIPNTFTPNGDGINDFWDITALVAHPGCTVAIYSRYGELVYNSISYPKPWDGNFNGKQLPVGTYYYLIDLKNGQKPLAGSVTILR